MNGPLYTSGVPVVERWVGRSGPVSSSPDSGGDRGLLLGFWNAGVATSSATFFRFPVSRDITDTRSARNPELLHAVNCWGPVGSDDAAAGIHRPFRVWAFAVGDGVAVIARSCRRHLARVGPMLPIGMPSRLLISR